MAFINVNRIKFFFRVEGDPGAPPLVLSNSLGTDHRMWDGQMEDLTQHFRVVRYDGRGHGQSEAPEGPYTIEELAEDVLGLMDELHIGRTAFCGLSMGGLIGQWLGIHAPDRIGHLVLCNTAAKIGTAEMWNQRIANVENGGMKSIADAVVSRWFTKDFVRRNSMAVAAVKQMLLATDPQGYAGSCGAIRDQDLRLEVSKITAPTLVIVGRDDPAIPVEDATFLVDSIDGAWGKVLNAAHLSNVEEPVGFNDAVLKFLLTTMG